MDDGVWEVSYHIAQKYAGYGYETEAVKAFLPVVMKALNITEILGICVAENIPSIKVLKKAGFVKEFEGMGTYQDEEREICRFIYTL